MGRYTFDLSSSFNPTILASNEGWEPRRTNNFILTIDGIPKAVDQIDKISVAVIDFSPGDVEVEQHQIDMLNFFITVAGRARFSNGNIKCRDYLDQRTFFLLWTWYNMSFNISEEAVGYAIDYKRNATLEQFGPDGTKGKLVWKFYGCFITSISPPGTLSYDSNEFSNIDVNLQYDYFDLVSS